jgi:hypothetical protein
MLALLPLADGSQDLPGVKLLGLAIGAALLYWAVRRMFGRPKK